MGSTGKRIERAFPKCSHWQNGWTAGELWPENLVGGVGFTGRFRLARASLAAGNPGGCSPTAWLLDLGRVQRFDGRMAMKRQDAVTDYGSWEREEGESEKRKFESNGGKSHGLMGQSQLSNAQFIIGGCFFFIYIYINEIPFILFIKAREITFLPSQN